MSKLSRTIDLSVIPKKLKRELFRFLFIFALAIY